MHNTATDIDSFIRQRVDRSVWKDRRLRHKRRISELIDDYLEKRQRHRKDPVMDFLFEYYAFRPSHLRRWSPGFGVLLEGDNFEELEIDEMVRSADGSFLNPDFFPDKRKSSMFWILNLLEKSEDKSPSFGCFGMHEWAMVYRADRIRHSNLPLRMSKEELARFVESRPLVCTHYDAYRFFTEEARPMNRHKLNREIFSDMEQPGCLHTNMDLYKWAFKMYPWISSDTIREAFELAVRARLIDMKASPYDLSARGLEPIRIETAEGRKDYMERQYEIFENARPVRRQLIGEYRHLVEHLGAEQV